MCSTRWGVAMRLTYRTARVLEGIAEHPGSSNRQAGERAGISDPGQVSKLLARLERLGLLANHGSGHVKGEPNAWTLTAKGEMVARSIRMHSPNRCPVPVRPSARRCPSPIEGCLAPVRSSGRRYVNEVACSFPVRALLAALSFRGDRSLGVRCRVGRCPRAGACSLRDVCPTDVSTNRSLRPTRTATSCGAALFGSRGGRGRRRRLRWLGCDGRRHRRSTRSVRRQTIALGVDDDIDEAAQLGQIHVHHRPPLTLVPSSRFLALPVHLFGPYVSAEPLAKTLARTSSSPKIRLSNRHGSGSRVAQPDPTLSPGINGIRNYLIVGGSPDLSTVFFTFSGTLIPQDASRRGRLGIL